MTPPAEPRRLLVIGNPAAGGVDGQTREKVLATLADDADALACDVAEPGDLGRILGEHPGRIPVVLGGDGTVHAVVAALLVRARAPP